MKKTMFLLSLMILGISLSASAQEPIKQKREVKTKTLQPKTIDRNSMQIKMDTNLRAINKLDPKAQNTLKRDNKSIRNNEIRRVENRKTKARLERNSTIKRVEK